MHMKATIRTSLDIPRDLHRRLREAAARKGCSARQLVLASIRDALSDKSPRGSRTRLKLDPPIVSSRGKAFTLTNEQIHELIELP
jgi:hypothetical protein